MSLLKKSIIGNIVGNSIGNIIDVVIGNIIDNIIDTLIDKIIDNFIVLNVIKYMKTKPGMACLNSCVWRMP